ncbi:hypothetical protein ZOSMA_10G01470 [Zostera marina]|uniref:GH16 domain-containing protein n=1 Tax=Zostera marina TaxID=29655 RepID=A0A0K9Q3L6_ZOSMR|nr:hypothetical protein ZOSMA_10G01470 [Zostera marina]
MRITLLPLRALLAAAVLASVNAANFLNDVAITWGGDGRAMILDGGSEIKLNLDKNSGSGFQSKKEYMFGRFDMEIKVVPGDAAGLVTTFYVSNY